LKNIIHYRNLTSGGLAGNIIAIHVFVALYLYFERLMAINASKIDNFMGQIRENIRMVD
jgi:hypothetical protein